MIKSISYWSFDGGLEGTASIEGVLKQAKAARFAGVELCFGLEGELTPETPEQRCKEIRALAADLGVVTETAASGMSWAINPTSDDAATRKRAVQAHAAALQRAAWLGCDALLFVPGVVSSPISPEEKIPYAAAVERAREAVNELLPVAERVGVDLCLENVWNGLFYSPSEFADFVDSFGSERLGVYLDLGNLLGYQQHPPHWIDQLGARIKRIHVKDFKEEFDWRGAYHFCDLGTGDLPWQDSREALERLGYDKTLVAELLPYSEGLIERTSAAMDRMLG